MRENALGGLKSLTHRLLMRTAENVAAGRDMRLSSEQIPQPCGISLRLDLL
jgi:hypothetical protein